MNNVHHNSLAINLIRMLIIIGFLTFHNMGCSCNENHNNEEGKQVGQVDQAEQVEQVEQIEQVSIDSLKEQQRSLKAEIEEIVGNVTCNAASQCRAIAFGSNPCGEPWSYLIYNQEDVDIELMETKVALYNDIDEQLNQIEGLGSNCSYATYPEIDCQYNQCVKIEDTTPPPV